MASAIGGTLPDAPPHTAEVLDRHGDVMLVRYRTPAMGLTLEHLEEVRLEAPDAVAYRLIRGPLKHVRERLTFTTNGDATIVTYSGEFGHDGPIGGLIVRLIAIPAYRRFMRRSLHALRRAAEARAARSRRYPSPAGTP